MSGQANRSDMVIASAIIIVGVLISASVFVAFTGMPKTTTTTTTETIRVNCTDHFNNGTASSVTDCVRGLTLGISDTPAIAAGSNQTVDLTLSNGLNARSINYTGFPTLPGLNPSDPRELDYLLPVLSGCGFPSGNPPVFMGLLNASGDPVQLSDVPPNLSSCLSGPGGSYPFDPSQSISERFSVGGYWTSPSPGEPWVNATYHQLPPGNFTVVAFDPWQQLAELSFTVTGTAAQIFPVTFQQVRYCGQYNILPWAVTINGLTQVQPSNQTLPLPTDHFATMVSNQSLTRMTFYLPPGTYAYTVSGGGGFGGEVYPGSGTVPVAGALTVDLNVILGFTCARRRAARERPLLEIEEPSPGTEQRLLWSLPLPR